MFEQRIFETDFKTALSEELDRRGMTVRQLSEATGIPPVTLYKISSGERDPRLSTVKKIVSSSLSSQQSFCLMRLKEQKCLLVVWSTA